MKFEEIIRIILGSTVVTAIIGFVGKQMGWIRFQKKDTAQVNKINSETQVDLAEVANKKIDDEVKISKAALEWTIQLAGQLEKSNMINDKRQAEIDRLHSVMQQMRDDFEKRMNEMEDLLTLNQKELDEEKEQRLIEQKKNKDLLDQLNKYLNAGKE